MINYKVAEVCDISIHCEVTLEMWTADSGKAFFYSCAENVKVEMIDVISTFFIFVAEGVENELIFKCFWEQTVEVNIFNWADESVEWTIHSFKKKIVFLNCSFKTTLLCIEKDVFSAILN